MLLVADDRPVQPTVGTRGILLGGPCLGQPVDKTGPLQDDQVGCVHVCFLLLFFFFRELRTCTHVLFNVITNRKPHICQNVDNI